MPPPQRSRSRVSPTAIRQRIGQQAPKAEAPTNDAGAKMRLIEAAITLCCRKGVAGTSVDEIVGESGVARMTLYNRYGSKDALIQAALAHEAGVWRAWFFTRLAETRGSPDERLFALFDILEEWFTREDYLGCALMNAAMESRQRDRKLDEIIHAHKSHLLDQLRALVAATGAVNVEEFAQQLDLLMDGAIVKAAIKRSPTPAREAKSIVKALLSRLPRNAEAELAP